MKCEHDWKNRRYRYCDKCDTIRWEKCSCIDKVLKLIDEMKKKLSILNPDTNLSRQWILDVVEETEQKLKEMKGE